MYQLLIRMKFPVAWIPRISRAMPLQRHVKHCSYRTDISAKGKSFAVETTLSGNRPLELMDKAVKAGFVIDLQYIRTQSPEQSLARIKDRVALGGHNIPVKDVERRFERSMDNLPKALAMADRATLYDNSVDGARPFAAVELRNGTFTVSTDAPEWAANIVVANEFRTLVLPDGDKPKANIIDVANAANSLIEAMRGREPSEYEQIAMHRFIEAVDGLAGSDGRDRLRAGDENVLKKTLPDQRQRLGVMKIYFAAEHSVALEKDKPTLKAKVIRFSEELLDTQDAKPKTRGGPKVKR